MATYGVDYYGKSFYGGPLLVDYAVGNLTAGQLGFGRVRVTWSAPAPNIWTTLVLVRSRYGYPVSPTDGQELGTWSSTQASTSFDDVDLTPGYWYYAMFAATPLPAWQAALTYQVGDRVSYSAQNWICVQLAVPGTAPGGGSSYWSETGETQIWQPAGAVGTMSVADHGYSALMYSLIPGAYKASPTISTDSSEINDDLADFLGVLAFGFEITASELDDMYLLYTPETTRWDRLLQISEMLGISAEAASSPRYQRLRTRDAASLARSKGTVGGLAAMIAASTGLECEITTGANLMLSRDQSDFPFPIYPDWRSDESYAVGELATYQGVRYVCSAYVMDAIALGVGAFSGSPNAVSALGGIGANISQVAAAPSTLAVTLTVPVSGVYQLALTFGLRPTGGIVALSVDGVGEQLLPQAAALPLHITPVGWGVPTGYVANVDTYAAATSASQVYTYLAFLTAGAHTFSLAAATKNASSTGYDIVTEQFHLAGVFTRYPPSSTAPNSAATNGVQWLVAAPGTTPVTEYANPVTGGVSTWNGVPGMGVYYYGPGAGAGIASSNWLTTSTGALSNASTYVLSSAQHPAIAAYNGATAYTAGDIVTYQGLQYQALVASTGSAPPAPGVWARSSYASPYDRDLIAQSCVPLHGPGAWDPRAAYTQGQTVTYAGSRYVAPAATRFIAPPASPGSNSAWEYAGPAGRAFTGSFYTPTTGGYFPTGTVSLLYPGVSWYDANGQPIAFATMMNSSGTMAASLPLYARLAEPAAELGGAYLDAGGAVWSANPSGFWQVSAGACFANPGYAGSAPIKLLTVASSFSDGCVGVSFQTGVASVGVRDVGFVFRYSDATHFWAVTRSKIVTYNGGVLSTVASYTRLPIGSRAYVVMAGSTISLYAYPGAAAAPVLVTTVTSSFNQTATVHGLVDWTW